MDPKNITWEQHEVEMKRYSCIENAKKVLHKLKLDLATRQDNSHVGSKIGGNVSELFFLMTHRVKFEASKDDLVHFVAGENDEVILESPVEHNISQARKALTEFYNSHPDKKELTQEQVTNPSFLRDLNSPSIEIKILIRVLEEALALQSWLDSKIAFRTQIREFFGKETKALQVHFLREMKLDDNYFATLPKEKETYQEDPMGRMFRKHPVWGVRNDAVNKRIQEIEDRLLSQEDNDKLKFIGSCPPHITLFVFRSIIQIDRIVTLNLDENESCSFLTDINKDVESLDASSDEE